jgi:hypothetical protein
MWVNDPGRVERWSRILKYEWISNKTVGRRLAQWAVWLCLVRNIFIAWTWSAPTVCQSHCSLVLLYNVQLSSEVGPLGFLHFYRGENSHTEMHREKLIIGHKQEKWQGPLTIVFQGGA